MLDGGQAASALSKSGRFLLLGSCLVLWAATGNGLFFLVAGGATYRLFTKDVPPMPSPRITASYLAVLTVLAVVIYFMPGQGFGRP